MQECMNPNVGNLILSYELGKLNEEEKDIFEQHLFECQFCANEAFNDIQFVDILKTAIKENITVSSFVLNFAQLQKYSSEQLAKLREYFEASIETVHQTPKYTVICADVEEETTQKTLKAIVEDVNQGSIGQTEVHILEEPTISHGAFTMVFTIPNQEYIGCDVSVGIDLKAHDTILSTEYETIPSDGMIFIREEIGFEGEYTLPDAMLKVTIRKKYSEVSP